MKARLKPTRWTIQQSLHVEGDDGSYLPVMYGIRLPYLAQLVRKRMEADPGVSMLDAAAEAIAHEVHRPDAVPQLREQLLAIFPDLDAPRPFTLSRTLAPGAGRADIVIRGGA